MEWETKICILRAQARTVCLCIFTLSGGPVAADRLFETDNMLHAQLTGPISQTTRERAASPEALPYQFLLDGVSFSVMVKPRGASRRQICQFPPLRIQILDPPDESILAGQKTLKLVTHCSNNREGEQNVLKEYAAYRLFNVLTSSSFRVRLLRMSYLDSEKPNRKATERWAFLIEDKNHLANRLGAELIERSSITVSSLDQAHAAMLGMWQYMTGNTDYSMTARRGDDHCCHNSKIVSGESGFRVIPYDFDQSGIVDASYAGPNPIHDGPDPRIRAYVGPCFGADKLVTAAETIVEKRSELLAVVENIPGMSKSSRKRTTRYLSQFFAQPTVSRRKNRCGAN